MGKKFLKRKKKGFPQQPGPEKVVKTNDQPYLEKKDLENAILKAYYKIQFLEQYFNNDMKLFDEFWVILKEKLPITLRINNTIPNYENFVHKIENKLLMKKDFTKLSLQSQKQVGTQPPQSKQELADQDPEKLEEYLIQQLPLDNIKWYPKHLVWQLSLDKTQLKKSEYHKIFHLNLQRASDAGLISRQELVSMLPPIFMDIKSSDLVFDMCAAPGSKTTELLELMYSSEADLDKVKGCVVANDVDIRRAFMLTHQINRVNFHGMIVINHPAQFVPHLQNPNATNMYDKKLYFDKILADVPCSGDGAIRKIPLQWANWNTYIGQGLHVLQLLILQRALNLVKVGGVVLYSTCSLNPLEDEAVVAEVLRKAQGSVELVDIHGKFPGLKSRRGLNSWKVLSNMVKKENLPKSQEELEKLKPEDIFKEFSSMEDIKDKKYGKLIRSTHFPPYPPAEMNSKINIQHCMRILPHDQDTGGFFLALLKKKDVIVWDKTRDALRREKLKQEQQQAKPEVQQPAHQAMEQEPQK